MESCSIEIIDNQKNEILSNIDKIKNPKSRKRAYVSLLGIYAVEEFLRNNNINADKSNCCSNNPVLLEEFDVADIKVNDFKIDVRVIVGNDYPHMYIPRNHLVYDFTPDIYIGVQLNSNATESEIVGFIESAAINNSSGNTNYIIVESADLKPISELEGSMNTLNEKSKYFSSQDHDKAKELFLSYLDNEISNTEKEYLVRHISNCNECKKDFDTLYTLNRAFIKMSKQDDIKETFVAVLQEKEQEPVCCPEPELLTTEDDDSNSDLLKDTLIAGTAAAVAGTAIAAAGAMAADSLSNAIVDKVVDEIPNSAGLFGKIKGLFSKKEKDDMPDISENAGDISNLAKEINDIEGEELEILDDIEECDQDYTKELNEQENYILDGNIEDTYIDIEEEFKEPDADYLEDVDNVFGDELIEQETNLSDEVTELESDFWDNYSEELNEQENDKLEGYLEEVDLNIGEEILEPENDNLGSDFEGSDINLEEASDNQQISAVNNEEKEAVDDLSEFHDMSDNEIFDIEDFYKLIDDSATEEEKKEIAVDSDMEEGQVTPESSYYSNFVKPDPVEINDEEPLEYEETQEKSDLEIIADKAESDAKIDFLLNDVNNVEVVGKLDGIDIGPRGEDDDENTVVNFHITKREINPIKIAVTVILATSVSLAGYVYWKHAFLLKDVNPDPSMFRTQNTNNTAQLPPDKNNNIADKKPVPQKGQKPPAKPKPKPVKPYVKKVNNNDSNNLNDDIARALASQNGPVKISNISWEISASLAFNPVLKNYLMVTGQALKSALATDLTLATDSVTNDRVKVQIILDLQGNVLDSKIQESSGSGQIDKIVLQTLKNTLSYTKLPSIQTNKKQIKVGLIVNL